MAKKSGVYILRVLEKLHSLNYSVLRKVYKYTKGTLELFELEFAKSEIKDDLTSDFSERATVRISFEPELDNVLKFEVNLGSIPMDSAVTVWFKDASVANIDTFYTDSNGLEMLMRRVKKGG